ncbi:MAG: hypothetical protein N4A46_07320 [Schleiferiaceae bacterium]|jgi:hypothetical protein|nr:hypothetical protein [Schleiferiaceae bacterium]
MTKSLNRIWSNVNLYIPLFVLLCGQLKADLITLIRADQCETIIEYFVSKQGLKVTLEIGPNDFEAFKELIEPLRNKSNSTDLSSHDFQQFFKSHFPIQSGTQLLSPHLKVYEARKRVLRASLYSGEIDTSTRLSEKVLYVELFYPCNKVNSLTISPPVADDGNIRLSNIGFVLYHNNLPVNDLRYLSSPATVSLNWEDPWYSTFDNKNLSRHHSNSLMSFLYIDPYEVRHEVLVRLKDLEDWLPLSYNLDQKIPASHLDSIKTLVGEFIQTRNPLKMDGQPKEAILKKVHFLKVSLAGTQIMATDEDLDYTSAIIGVILSYPNPGIPQSVTIDWNMFSKQITSIPYVNTDPAGPLPGIIDADAPEIKWVNYLKKYKLPTIAQIKTTNRNISSGYLLFPLTLALGLLFIKKRKKRWAYTSFAITGILIFSTWLGLIKHKVSLPLQQTSFQIDEAKALNGSILNNIYHAFDFTNESDIYDKLSLSIQGDLLAEVYIQIKQSMELEDQDGLEVNVSQIETKSAIEHEKNGHLLAYNVQWIVNGEIGHWGHIHQRINAYQAVLYLDVFDGVWKLTDIKILNEERLI